MSNPTLRDWLTLLQTNYDKSIVDQLKNIDSAEAAIKQIIEKQVTEAYKKGQLDPVCASCKKKISNSAKYHNDCWEREIEALSNNKREVSDE